MYAHILRHSRGNKCFIMWLGGPFTLKGDLAKEIYP